MPDRNLWVRHLKVSFSAGLLVVLFWLSRIDWDPEMRFWRALGDASWILLWVLLLIGPLSRLWKPAVYFLSWRREIGIWFGILAFTHAVLILNGWVRWDVARFFGYEFIPELGRLARIEPGFGLANVVGLIALIWALLLTATSSDRALRRLGSSGWKWLHSGAYVLFYLVALHTFYFLFLHYSLSFHRPVPPNPNWLSTPFVILTLSIPLIQAIAFTKTVSERKKARVRS